MVDNYIINKIACYLPNSKVYSFSKYIHNKILCRYFFEKVHLHSVYVVYPSKSLEIVVIPKNKNLDYDVNYNKNFEGYNNSSIKNNMFFYMQLEKEIYAFQFIPPKTEIIVLDENIDELYFYSKSDTIFWLVVNHTHVYKFNNYVRETKINLSEGFFFEEFLIDEIVYSNFFGEQFVVHNLIKNKSFNIEFSQSAYYSVLSKEYILVDFSQTDKLIDPNPLPNNTYSKPVEKRNSLFKFHFVDNYDKGRISLEFISFLPYPLNFESFNEYCCYFWAKDYDSKFISLWSKEKELGKIFISNMEDTLAIDKLDGFRIYIEFRIEIHIVDFARCNIINKIDLTSRIPQLKTLGHFESIGDYYKIIVLLNQKEIGAYRHYILDQDLFPIYELKEYSASVFFD